MKNSFVSAMRNIYNNYSKFLKEETRKRSMTPKEYGIMLQKKKKRRCRG